MKIVQTRIVMQDSFGDFKSNRRGIDILGYLRASVKEYPTLVI